MCVYRKVRKRIAVPFCYCLPFCSSMRFISTTQVVNSLLLLTRLYWTSCRVVLDFFFLHHYSTHSLLARLCLRQRAKAYNHDINIKNSKKKNLNALFDQLFALLNRSFNKMKKYILLNT